MAEKSNAYMILAEKPERKRPHARHKRRWEHNIKIELSEIGRGDVDLNHVDQSKDQWRVLVNTVMNIEVPYNFEKFLSS
jgi:hypothetical protein